MSPLQVIVSPISRSHLKQLAAERFGDMVKAVVDVKRGSMAIGGELHADEEQELLAGGSRQEDLWGINLYPDRSGADWIEFDSMINIRPGQGNRSRSVDNPSTQEKIRSTVNSLVLA